MKVVAIPLAISPTLHPPCHPASTARAPGHRRQWSLRCCRERAPDRCCRRKPKGWMRRTVTSSQLLIWWAGRRRPAFRDRIDGICPAGFVKPGKMSSMTTADALGYGRRGAQATCSPVPGGSRQPLLDLSSVPDELHKTADRSNPARRALALKRPRQSCLIARLTRCRAFAQGQHQQGTEDLAAVLEEGHGITFSPSQPAGRKWRSQGR